MAETDDQKTVELGAGVTIVIKVDERGDTSVTTTNLPDQSVSGVLRAVADELDTHKGS